jgi:hypothetical protein
MSCDDNTCGTGGWDGPKPGDPNNDISLSANTVYAGINVVWSYPTLNPHAVAHTHLYRGTNADFAQAVKQATVAGSVYYDKLNPAVDTEYYYWIQMVSINGTSNTVIGPASAIAKPIAAQTLESLTGLIDDGVLAQSLKGQIDSITMVDGKIATEIQNRINANAVLAAALAAVQSGVTQAMTYVGSEITQRQTNDSALVVQLNTLATAVANNFAMFLEERTVRTTKDESYVNSFQLLFAQSGSNAAAVQTEATARATADSALASQITTVQSSLNGNIASVSQSFATQIVATNGKVFEIGALYTVKVDVNGLVGGFGIYNTGQIVEAGFDVDRFWVGRTGPDKVKPFIIDGGVVYMDKARIRNADIDTLKIAGNSVMIGVYDSAGSTSVPANSYATLITRTLDMGDGNNSGVIVSATCSANHSSACTVGFQILINGVVCGDQRASMLGGFGYLFPVSGQGSSGGNRFVTVELRAYNPNSGAGSNSPFTVSGSTMSIMGGKR